MLLPNVGDGEHFTVEANADEDADSADDDVAPEDALLLADDVWLG